MMNLKFFGGKMANKHWGFLILFAVSINFGFTALTKTVQDCEDQSALEKFLKTAKIVSVIPDEEAGRTEPWKIVLTEGEIRRMGYFKHLSLVPMMRDSYKFELAAYELSKMLQLIHVPPVIEREIEGINGSLQIFLEDCKSLIKYQQEAVPHPDPEKYTADLHAICVLEQLTFCKRDEEDIFVDIQSGQLFRVDFSEAFAPEHSLLPGFKIENCSEQLVSSLTQLNEKQVHAGLDIYLNSDEIAAILVRRDLLLEKIKK